MAGRCHRSVESRVPGYAPGDYLFNTNGWQQYGVTGDGVGVSGYMVPRKLDPSVAPISTAVGVLGMLGLTAYAGVVVQCRPRAGETVVVSAASGGVGQAAGQIAKLHGCRVVGVAGRKEKCDFVTHELGFDACVSYRSPSYREDLAAGLPRWRGHLLRERWGRGLRRGAAAVEQGFQNHPLRDDLAIRQCRRHGCG